MVILVDLVLQLAVYSLTPLVLLRIPVVMCLGLPCTLAYGLHL
jgi:hypothetical protein